MSSASNKIIQAAAGNAAGEALYVEDVFSTYLYEGNGSTQTITNGIDLDGEGGLVWIKTRNTTRHGYLWDTERGVFKAISSSLTNAEAEYQDSLTDFNSDGFGFNETSSTNVRVNNNGDDYASWTFRKAPKFFDVVTWTGDGDGNREIPHNLGCIPGAIFCKRLDTSSNWAGYHIGQGITSGVLGLSLHATNAPYFTGINNSTRFSDTMFKPFELYDYTTADRSNASGGTYVAYLFAHNDGDGEFGENGDQDIIKCGSYTGNQNSDGPEINLGFEPQWIMIKGIDSATSWVMVDVMRGIVTGDLDSLLFANGTNAELTGSYDLLEVTPTGFKMRGSVSGTWNNNNEEFIYIAIRRGPMKTPTSGTDVFDLHTSSPSVITTGFPVDAILAKYATSNWDFVPRLTEGSLATSTTSAEVDYSAYLSFASNTAFLNSGVAFNSAAANWCFRRAPGFFDVVAYTGTGTEPRTVYHNLGVAPEMIWTKRRDSGSLGWVVWHKVLTTNTWLRLDSTQAETSSPAAWGGTFSADNYTIANDPYDAINGSGGDLIAYLFATVPGVSKVGSYSGTSALQVVDCGFSAGARFLIIKRTDSTGSWYVWDTERGIVTGNDPWLLLDSTSAENTTTDYIDPNSSGFELSASSSLNVTGREFIFLAIA